MKIKALGIRIDDALHKELKHLSIEMEKSLNTYIVELIKADLEKRKKKK